MRSGKVLLFFGFFFVGFFFVVFFLLAQICSMFTKLSGAHRIPFFFFFHSGKAVLVLFQEALFRFPLFLGDLHPTNSFDFKERE